MWQVYRNTLLLAEFESKEKATALVDKIAAEYCQEKHLDEITNEPIFAKEMSIEPSPVVTLNVEFDDGLKFVYKVVKA